MSITLTEAAANRVMRFTSGNEGALGLRFGVRRTGCSGWGYVTEVALSQAPGDTVFEDRGVRVYVDADSLPLVAGTRIDFVRQGLNEVFTFDNPRAAAECGCGESFTTDEQAA